MNGVRRLWAAINRPKEDDMNSNRTEAFNPPVRPDPAAAAELERRFAAVAYRPRGGFTREKKGTP